MYAIRSYYGVSPSRASVPPRESYQPSKKFSAGRNPADRNPIKNPLRECASLETRPLRREVSDVQVDHLQGTGDGVSVPGGRRVGGGSRSIPDPACHKRAYRRLVRTGGVITSYSIHYTKLYDPRRRRTALSRRGPGRRIPPRGRTGRTG